MSKICKRTYDLVLREQTGPVIGPLHGEIDFHYALKENAVGALTINLFRDRCMIGSQPFDNLSGFILSPEAEDLRIEVWRTSSGVRTLVGDAPFFLQLAVSSQDKSGKRLVKIEADDSQSLMDRRINPYHKDHGCAKLGPAPADDVMKEAVTCNYSAAAASYNATPDAIRNLSAYLQIQGNLGLAPTYEAQGENQGVLDILSKAAKYSMSQGTPLLFRPVQINHMGNPFLEFRTYVGQRGTDRTQTAGGRVLTPEGEGIVSYELSMNWRETASRMYAGGKGSGAGKTYRTVDDPTLSGGPTPRLSYNPFALREKMHTANTDEAAKILAEANAELWAQYRVATVTGELGQTALDRYGSDLFWGDKVSVMVDGLFFDVYLDTEEVKYENQQETLTVSFSSDLARKYTGVASLLAEMAELRRQFDYAANKDYIY